MGLDLRSQILRYAVRLANRHPLPERIPLSDREKVVARKYTGAYFTDQEGRRKFYAETVTDQGIDGRWFDTAQGPSSPRFISNEELSEFGIEFSQYYAELEIEYHSALEFVIYQWLGMPKLALLKARILQWVYNTQRLAADERIDVLTRFLVRTQEDDEYRTGIDRYLTTLYGPRWQNHGDNLKLYYYHEMLFRSLVETGELVEENHAYRMTPKAIVTLESFEEASKRHREMARLQIILIGVTAVLAIVGLAQAYSGLVAAGKPFSALWQ